MRQKSGPGAVRRAVTLGVAVLAALHLLVSGTGALHRAAMALGAAGLTCRSESPDRPAPASDRSSLACCAACLATRTDGVMPSAGSPAIAVIATVAAPGMAEVESQTPSWHGGRPLPRGPPAGARVVIG